MSRLPGISDEQLARAGLTDKQIQALQLYNPPHRGYRSVALALDLAFPTARDRIRAGLRRLEVAMRDETPAGQRSDAPAPRKRQPAGIQPFA